jgi:hypothetical protein
MSWSRFHPLSRIAIVVMTILSLALLAGFERVGNALASFTPRGSFENRCAELPASDVDVRLSPLEVVENRSEPFVSLATMTRDRSLEHRTIGVTQANFGHRSVVDVKGIEDRRQARACVRPRVKVELFVQPITVYIAREYAADPCRVRAIREHEQRHVEVFDQFAREAKHRLGHELAQLVGDAPHFGLSLEDAQRQVDRRIADALSAFMRDAERTLAERQAGVDTPAEYARVNNACNAG